MKTLQSGAVLVVSLVLLLILTILGLSAMIVSSSEEKMAGAFRDQQLAFQAAEAALREAEAYVQTSNLDYANFATACTGGLCRTATVTIAGKPYCTYATGAAAKPWETDANTDGVPDLFIDTAKSRAVVAKPDEVATAARYIVEWRCYTYKDPLNPPPASNLAQYENMANWARFYRITVLATGGSNESRVMLQSAFKIL